MTASTAASLPCSASLGGTRNGIPAALILVFARVRRRFIVSCGTRNARAISGVLRPATARSVSATCASVASAGWQQVKMSSSRSSGITVTACSAVSVGTSSSRSLVASTRSRRRRSIARLRAVVTSQAAGCSGGPTSRQRCAAIANASAAASSARSKSPKEPASAATTRPHWSRKTRSINVSVDHDRTDLHGAAETNGGNPRRELGRLVQVVGLVQVEPGKYFLGVRERTVGDQRLPVLQADRGRRLHRLQPGSGGHPRHLPDRPVLLVELRPLRFAGCRESIRLAVDQQGVLHVRFLRFLDLPIFSRL